VVNSDETGYRTNGEKRWLWAMVAPGFIFYFITSRLRAEPKYWFNCLGAVFAGILCSDRCPSYLKYHKGVGQFCWAHLKRNVLGVLKSPKRPRRRGSVAICWHCTHASSGYGIDSATDPA
jgi:hypothetical protein